jgi:hypothetical protein
MCGTKFCNSNTTGSVIRNGVVREGRMLMNEAMKARWDQAVFSEFSDNNLRRWMLEGGEIN